MQHQLYRDGDVSLPEAILDRNGRVVLDQCKLCGLAEAELTENSDCPGPRNEAEVLRVRAERLRQARQEYSLTREEIRDYRERIELLQDDLESSQNEILKLAGFVVGTEVKLMSEHDPEKCVFHGEVTGTFAFNSGIRVNAYYADGRKHKRSYQMEATRLTDTAGSNFTRFISVNDLERWVIVPKQTV